MNILIGILWYPPDFTGAGLRIHKLYSHLKKKGVNNVYVITTSLSKLENKIRIYEGMEIIYIGENKYAYATDQKYLLKKLSKAVFIVKSCFRTVVAFLKIQSQVDIVHTIDSSWLSTVIGWCAFFVKKPLMKEIVLLGCDDPSYLSKSKSYISKYFFLFPFWYAKLIVVISPPLKDACIKYGISADKIWCRINPVYLDNTNDEEGKNLINKYLDLSAKRILWVGSVESRKNLEFLLESAFHLEGRVQLIMVGPHPDEDYFNKIMFLSKKISQVTNGRIQTSFLGRIDNRKELTFLYKNSHLFWFASHNEGLGNVVIESLLCGTPVVTLPIDGVMEYVIVNKGDGEIVNTRDPRYFATMVNRCLYANNYDRDKIAERARRNFNAEQIEDEYLNKFNNILRLK